ncbi:MAG: hypothetical protein AB1781_04605 [Pseudomonadota bacterium]
MTDRMKRLSIAGKIFGGGSLLLALSLLLACGSTEATSEKENYRSQAAAYCKEKAQAEKLRYVREARREKNTGTDLGGRVQQAFNQAYDQCLEAYGVPRTSSGE